MPNAVVMPGGHPEPEEAGVLAHAPTTDSAAAAAGNTAVDEKVRAELFAAMVREVEEETGVPATSLGPPRCLGFTRRVMNHRPDIIFHIPCALSSKEVLERYKAVSGEHKDESTGVFTMARDEFVRQVLEQDSKIPMPGCHRGGVELYRRFLLDPSGATGL